MGFHEGLWHLLGKDRRLLISSKELNENWSMYELKWPHINRLAIVAHFLGRGISPKEQLRSHDVMLTISNQKYTTLKKECRLKLEHDQYFFRMW